MSTAVTVWHKIVSCRSKQEITKDAAERQDLGHSLKSIYRDHDVQPSQVRQWHRLEEELKKSDPNATSTHRGRPSWLECVSVLLLRWMFDLRKKGMPVSIRMVYLKAGELNACFCQKLVPAKYAAVRRFVRSHQFFKTHVSQRPPSETQQEALDFVTFMRPWIIGRHRHPD